MTILWKKEYLNVYHYIPELLIFIYWSKVGTCWDILLLDLTIKFIITISPQNATHSLSFFWLIRVWVWMVSSGIRNAFLQTLKIKFLIMISSQCTLLALILWAIPKWNSVVTSISLLRSMIRIHQMCRVLCESKAGKTYRGIEQVGGRER